MSALFALLACGPDVDALLADLQSDNPTLRQDALSEAGIDDPRVIEALSETASDPDARIRLDALRTLDGLRTEAALPAFVQHLEDPDPAVSRAAIDALGHLGHEGAVEPLVRLLNVPDPPRNAIWALGQTGSPAAVAPLAALRSHPDATIRYLADEALRELGG